MVPFYLELKSKMCFCNLEIMLKKLILKNVKLNWDSGNKEANFENEGSIFEK